MKILKYFVFSLLISLVASAQDSTAADDFFADVEEAYNDEKRDEVKEEIDALEGTVAITEALIKEKADYHIFSLEHRKKVFSWQLTAGKIIFVFVMLIVLSGLALSYMHFYKGLKSGEKDEATNLEMSASGIKINSSVIGLVILVLAIAFLYLYLVHVFPINEFNVDASTYVSE